MTVTDHRSTGPTDVDGGRGDGAWAVLLPAGRYDAERLVHHDTLELTLPAGAPAPPPGDPVAVLADEPPRLVALGRVARLDGETLLVTYTRRSFDTPVPVGSVAVTGPVSALDPGTYRQLVDRLGPPPLRRTWLVSLDLPIEAESQAEAVRLFWSYVRELGPAELPAFVSPSGDELAMQAFVLGVEANQDPEEDD
ncbi:hypothetical protein GA0070216_13346 [Micromonospora matsumotoense]|uniref:Uncharacterized protein n=1 Tax=Micromonospora matsumotoense TaxID=121616 RepID=A0A1C5AVQ2_9ACTN|nr:hypothetical protein [Micromonospora matsumotoense]SCF49305.1 hypothetical protein GA0070216_13346 [Micromonospora matsumotoense]